MVCVQNYKLSAGQIWEIDPLWKTILYQRLKEVIENDGLPASREMDVRFSARECGQEGGFTTKQQQRQPSRSPKKSQMDEYDFISLCENRLNDLNSAELVSGFTKTTCSLKVIVKWGKKKAIEPPMWKNIWMKPPGVRLQTPTPTENDSRAFHNGIEKEMIITIRPEIKKYRWLKRKNTSADWRHQERLSVAKPEDRLYLLVVVILWEEWRPLTTLNRNTSEKIISLCLPENPKLRS